MTVSQSNAHTLERELVWFSRVLDARMKNYFSADGATSAESVYSIIPPDLKSDSSEYAKIVSEFSMGFAERIVFILCLIPHIRPQSLDILFTQSSITTRSYTEFGGVKGKSHIGFLPTAETAVFILAGSNLTQRFAVQQLFDVQHYLTKQGIIKVDHQGNGEPLLNAAINITPDYLQRCTHGEVHKPDYSTEFPAKLITSKLGWDDLVLSPEVMEEIDHLNTWLVHHKAIISQWGLEKSIKPGYRSLFFGSSVQVRH